MSTAGLWFALGLCVGMATAPYGLSRHFAWLNKRQDERTAAAELLEGRP